MEIKLQLEEVLKINNVLKTIIEDKTLAIDVLLKFRLLGIMKNIESVIETFDTVRNEKIIEFGTENENGIFQIHNDDIEAMNKFKESLNNVLHSDVTITITPLKPGEIFNKDINTEYLKDLLPLIQE